MVITFFFRRAIAAIFFPQVLALFLGSWFYTFLLLCCSASLLFCFSAPFCTIFFLSCIDQVGWNDPPRSPAWRPTALAVRLPAGRFGGTVLERGTDGIRENMGEYTIWLFNIAMENGPFIDDFPIKTSIYEGFSMTMLNNQMVKTWHWVI